MAKAFGWPRANTSPYRGHAQAGANAELKSLFQKLACLYCIPSEVIFVFDGPAKPAIKRGKHVMKAPPWLTEPFKHFAQTLGFAVHDVSFSVHST
jgi:Holliday junction resolvase YEN1